MLRSHLTSKRPFAKNALPGDSWSALGWFLSGALLAVACGGRQSPAGPVEDGQSFADAVRLICTVDARLDPAVREDPLALSQARWDRIREEVTNADGIYLRTVLEAEPPARQLSLLSAEAARVGLGTCPLAVALGAADDP
ncbi:MAG: hypothetical protein JW751_15860 [Polyangiaceae bacterium]|nr:hypothetical protein [Polyangiaceae bacterium]